jgi:hypothetical protein
MPTPVTLRERLGITDAPLVRAGLATAEDFFRTVLHVDPMDWVDYLRGIDFHKPVSIERLARGTRLVRYESSGHRTLKPFAYFTVPGSSPHRLGTSFPSVEFKEFELDRDIRALKSIASGINFGPKDRVSRLGGGVQYIVAFADVPPLVRVGGR